MELRSFAYMKYSNVFLLKQSQEYYRLIFVKWHNFSETQPCTLHREGQQLPGLF